MYYDIEKNPVKIGTTVFYKGKSYVIDNFAYHSIGMGEPECYAELINEEGQHAYALGNESNEGETVVFNFVKKN